MSRRFSYHTVEVDGLHYYRGRARSGIGWAAHFVADCFRTEFLLSLVITGVLVLCITKEKIIQPFTHVFVSAHIEEKRQKKIDPRVDPSRPIQNLSLEWNTIGGDWCTSIHERNGVYIIIATLLYSTLHTTLVPVCIHLHRYLKLAQKLNRTDMSTYLPFLLTNPREEKTRNQSSRYIIKDVIWRIKVISQ
jgi:hypothetical protein